MNYFFGRSLNARSLFKYHKYYFNETIYKARNIIVERVIGLLKKESTKILGFDFNTLINLEYSTFTDIEETVDKIEEAKEKLKNELPKNPDLSSLQDINMQNL